VLSRVNAALRRALPGAGPFPLAVLLLAAPAALAPFAAIMYALATPVLP
jgi:hypothetical protein